MEITPKIKMYKKAIPILFVAFALVVGACSHSSQSESPSTVTLSDAEWERVVAERDRELEEIEYRSSQGDDLRFVPHYGFAPSTPEWNTAVVREAEEHKDSIISFNECRSFDLYYDFEKFSTGIIEKMYEINLRYVGELLSVPRWNVIVNLNLQVGRPSSNFDISNLPEEERARREDLPQIEIEYLENFDKFYEEVRAELADIIGNTTLRSIIVDFTYTTIPALKENFASIGIESGKSEPSRFQDMWEANPEFEEYAKDYLEFIENAEIQLAEFLEENDDVGSDFVIMPIYDLIFPPSLQDSDPIVEDIVFSARDTLQESFLIQPPEGCSLNSVFLWG